MLYVLSLEYRREYSQRVQAAETVNDGERYRTVRIEAILLRRCHYTAAVIASVHYRGEPYALVAVALSVYGNGRIPRTEAAEQPAERNFRIAYVVMPSLSSVIAPNIVCRFAAIAVKPEADIVNEQSALSAKCYFGQPTEISVYRQRADLAEIAGKVVARSGRQIVYFVSYRQPLYAVGKEAQRAVAAAENNCCILLESAEKSAEARYSAYIYRYGILPLLAQSAQGRVGIGRTRMRII